MASSYPTSVSPKIFLLLRFVVVSANFFSPTLFQTNIYLIHIIVLLYYYYYSYFVCLFLLSILVIYFRTIVTKKCCQKGLCDINILSIVYKKIGYHYPKINLNDLSYYKILVQVFVHILMNDLIIHLIHMLMDI